VARFLVLEMNTLKMKLEVELSIDTIGSVYTIFNDSGYVYSDYYTEEVSAGSWWVKAALATQTAADGVVATATWSNISVPPGMLASWVAYMDTVCDVPYIFTSSNWLPSAAITSDSEGAPIEIPFWSDMINNWKTIYTNNNDTPTGELFTSVNSWASYFFGVYNFVSCMYSPFGQIMGDSFYGNGSAQNGTTPWFRLLFAANWRTPVYLPSIITEALASTAEQSIIKATQNGQTRSFQVFHIAFWPQISYTDSTKQHDYLSLEEMVETINKMAYLLTYRRFIKLNLNPEYKVNKAVMPYFFLHVPLNKTISVAGNLRNEAFDAVVSPYSVRYIEDHNLHLLSRCMLWPKVFYISQNLVVWLPIIDLKPMLPDGATWDVDEPVFNVDQFSYLCVDMSYLADGCEMDSYLNKLRTSHLGFFAALAGLLPTALKVGTALFKTIVKPKDIDKASEPAPTAATGPNVDAAQTNNMAMAGISSLQQTTAGDPGSGGTVDLSSTVNVDPMQKILEAGKKAITNKKLRQAVTFGGKAIKFGRSFYNNYQKG